MECTEAKFQYQVWVVAQELDTFDPYDTTN